MRPALSVLVLMSGLCVALAGCFEGGTPPPPAPQVQPTLTLLGEGDCPRDVEVRLTNANDAPINVSSGGFHIKDANGVEWPITNAAESYYPSAHFPHQVQLAKGESAQGHVTFSVRIEAHPYNLTYDRDSIVASVLLNIPENGTQGCTAGSFAPAIELTAGLWTDGNLTFNVTDADPLYSMGVANLTFTVANATGGVFYHGPANASVAPSVVSVRVSYGDQPDFGWVSPGDQVRIRVYPSTPNPLHGGSLKVFHDGLLVGEATVP